MALDEPKDDDQVFEEKGTKYIMEKTIYDQAKPVNVDFVESPRGSGFQLTSNLAQPAGDGCGSCSC